MAQHSVVLIWEQLLQELQKHPVSEAEIWEKTTELLEQFDSLAEVPTGVWHKLVVDMHPALQIEPSTGNPCANRCKLLDLKPSDNAPPARPWHVPTPHPLVSKGWGDVRVFAHMH